MNKAGEAPETGTAAEPQPEEVKPADEGPVQDAETK
jgi:hypothetical protein